MEQRREGRRFHTLLLLVLSLFVNGSVSDLYLPKAQNVAWSSVNFKSLLTWSPKPSNYSYTVEYSELGEDRQRPRHCIRRADDECDLTHQLTNLKAFYTADVLSEPLHALSTDLPPELPYTKSGKFSPYFDTKIGKPEFRIEVSADKRKMTLHVQDVQTALFSERGQRLSIRDVFQNDLQYKVIYRKAKSTGKKEKTSRSSVIELTELERGESYCFNLQVFLAFRSSHQQLGELSHIQCSPEEDFSIFQEYSVGVVVGVVLLVGVSIAAVSGITVMCCRRRRGVARTVKEGLPLNGV